MMKSLNEVTSHISQRYTHHVAYGSREKTRVNSFSPTVIIGSDPAGF